MKKLLILLTIFAVTLAFFACSEDSLYNNSDDSILLDSQLEEGISTEKNTYITEYYSPDFEIIKNSNLRLLQWGEVVDYINHNVIFGSEEKYVGMTVHFYDAFSDVTLDSYYHSNSDERLSLIKDDNVIYDNGNYYFNDIILVPERMLDNIKKYDQALVTLDEEIIKTPDGNIHIYAIGYGEYLPQNDDYHFSIIPVIDGCMVYPENILERGILNYYASEIMMLFRFLENNLKYDKNFSLYESGVPISDLEEWLNTLLAE